MARYTVKLKKYADIINEYDAVAGITPGHLLELTSANKVQAHSTEGGNAVAYFALEDELQGKGIDDAYIAADKVQVWVAGRGDEVYALLANGENVSPGDLLESAGDGTLKKHVAGSAGVVEYPLAIIAQALEAVDMSGSSGVDPSGRICVRIV